MVALDAIVSGLQAFSSAAITYLIKQQHLCTPQQDLKSMFSLSILDFPTILLHFQSGSSSLPLAISPFVYLGVSQCPDGYVSFALQKQSITDDFSVLGNTFLSQYNTIFDSHNSRVGFQIPSQSGRTQECGCVYGYRSGGDHCVCFAPSNQLDGDQCDQISDDAASFLTAFNRSVRVR